MMAQKLNLSLSELYCTFYNDVFVLKTAVTINGQAAEIDFSKNDELYLTCRSLDVSLCFRKVSAQLGVLLRKYGVYQVNSVWCEAAPIVHIAFPSASDLMTFLNTKNDVEIDLASLFHQKLPPLAPEPHTLKCEVETELFLIVPNTNQKDARVISVTTDNCSECLSNLQESGVFQFGPLFEAFRSNPDRGFSNDGLALLELLSELAAVVGWFHFGLYLGIPDYELLSIDRFERGEVKQCKVRMLSLWLQQGTELTWTPVVRALEGIKMEPLARKIATKYGVLMPNRSQQPTPTAVVEVSAKVQENLEKTAQQLMATIETLKVEKKKKALIGKQRVEIKHQMKELSEKLKELDREKEEAKGLLEEKEDELEFLRLQEQEEKDDNALKDIIVDMEAEIQQLGQSLSRIEREMQEAKEAELATASELVEKLSEERDEVKGKLKRKETERHYLYQRQQKQKNSVKLRVMIERKEAEIAKLCKHMSDVQMELSQAKEEHKKLHDQLQKRTEELAEQSKHVRELEQTQGQLQRERLQADKKLEIETARRGGVELRTADVAGTEMDSLKQNIHERDEEIRKLTTLLAAKEAEEEERRNKHEKELEDEMRGEISDIRARLEDISDMKTRAEEELKNLQSRVTEMGTPDPQQCTAVFPHSQPTTGSIACFELHLSGKPYPHMHDVSIAGHLKSPADGSTTDIILESHSQAICNLSYKPTQRGRHQLTVSVNGKGIAGSPFPIHVQYPPTQLSRPVRVIEGLNVPRKVAITGSNHLMWTQGGKIVVDDLKSHELLKLSSDGELLEAVGGKGKGPGQFNSPDGVALFSNKVYVCDSGNDRVQIFDSNLKHLKSFGSHGSVEGKFNSPYDLAPDLMGHIYVTDRCNGRVQVFSENGDFIRAFGKPGRDQGELSFPAGIHVHYEHAYITEYDNERVSVYTTSGNFVCLLVDELSKLQLLLGVAVDSHGYIYVCSNKYNGSIFIY